MKFLVVFLFFAVAFVAAAEEKVSYRGYRMIRLEPKTDRHLELITQWEEDTEFDIWHRIRGVGNPVDISLSPIGFAKYHILFIENNLPYTVVTDDLQKRFDEEERTLKNHIGDRVVGTYARFDAISSWMDQVAQANPTLAATYVTGKTYQNRDMKIIKIGTATSRRKIWIDCGIHAREWVSPATCVYIVDKLINEYKLGDPITSRLLHHFEFHVMPVHNPDGYEYSFTARMWRKNRSPNAGSTCIGTDLNRNGAYQWMTGGSSNNPCSDTYAGRAPASELELQAVQRAINASWGHWDSYITIHSYGQWWFTPWGYTTQLPADYTELYNKALIGVNAIRGHAGISYVLGSGAVILYVSSGATDDWAKGVAGIKYSYCLELSPGQSGTDSIYGFQLPVDRAPRVGDEVWKGIKAFAHSIF